MTPTHGQLEALNQLRRIAAVNGAVRVLREHQQADHLRITISIDCSDLVRGDVGIRMEKRERFLIVVPPNFPFEVPHVYTQHTRWADSPHVYWGRLICLFISPAVEWDPSDGMAGFVERLALWLERAAEGQLDPAGQPLHPPFAMPTATGLVVVRATAPSPSSSTAWLGYAVLHRAAPDRHNLIDWIELDPARPPTPTQVRRAVDNTYSHASLAVAPTVLLPRPITSEYPDIGEKVLAILTQQGVARDTFFMLLASVIKTNRLLAGQRGRHNTPTKHPLHVVIGTPSLGISGAAERHTHVVVWQLQFPVSRGSTSTARSRRTESAPAVSPQQVAATAVKWTRVLDARTETVIRRDSATPASWLAEKQILVLGVGALGAPVAEACVRAGARKVVLVDRGFVNPGVLVRQPYGDEDIGSPKVDASAKRLRNIAPSIEIETHTDDILTMFDDDTPPPVADLIIDATADRAVSTLLERNRALHRDSWPATTTLMIGHTAARGIATIARPGASGGGADILRRLAITLRAHQTPALRETAEDFFPDPPRTTFFQPEPGCSDVTFIGSTADVTGLAGQLFAGVLSALNRDGGIHTMHALVAHMPSFPDAPTGDASRWFHWPNDVLVHTDDGRYETRIAPAAVAEMRAEARRGRRLRSPHAETGGSLLGGFDSAVGVLWIDEATPPPPDSLMSEIYFQHGTEGVAAHIEARSAATARTTSFVGMWHTHPYGDAVPSSLDNAGIARLVAPLPSTPPRACMLILGGQQQWEDWLNNGRFPDCYVTTIEANESSPIPNTPRLPELPPGMRWWKAGHTDPASRPRRGHWRLPRWWPKRRRNKLA